MNVGGRRGQAVGKGGRQVGARNFSFSYAFTTKQGDRTWHRFEKSDKHSPRTTPLPAYGGPLPAPLVRPSSPSFLSTCFTNDDCPQVSWHIPLGRFRFVGFLAYTSLIGRAQASVLAASEFRRAWPNQEVRSLWAPWPLGGNPTKPSGRMARANHCHVQDFPRSSFDQRDGTEIPDLEARPAMCGRSKK